MGQRAQFIQDEQVPLWCKLINGISWGIGRRKDEKQIHLGGALMMNLAVRVDDLPVVDIRQYGQSGA